MKIVLEGRKSEIQGVFDTLELHGTLSVEITSQDVFSKAEFKTQKKYSKKGLHWTQRPENAKKVQKHLKAMQKAFRKKRRPMGGVA